MFYDRHHQSAPQLTMAGFRLFAVATSRRMAHLALAGALLLGTTVPSNATSPLHTEDSSVFPVDVTTAFGRAVAVYGDTAVVGDPEDDRDGNLAGAAWVFVRNGTNWVEQARLTPSGASAVDQFGSLVDIYDNYIVVGAPTDTGAGATESGAVYEFGIRSLASPREMLQRGDPVRFFLERGTANVACLITTCHKKLRASVDSIKGMRRLTALQHWLGLTGIKAYVGWGLR